MNSTVTVSFRLTTTQFESLRLRAQELGLSPAALARVLVVEGPSAARQDDSALVEALARLEARLALVETVMVGRSDLAAAVAALFVALGVPRADAEHWVRTNLLPSEGVESP